MKSASRHMTQYQPPRKFSLSMFLLYLGCKKFLTGVM